MPKKIPSMWTTADGRNILYKDITKEHLSNIIKDGYRNPDIIKEAKRRRMKVPVRPVDLLSIHEVMMWLESFASCALEGNQLGEEMIALWDKNTNLFLLRLNQLLIHNERNKDDRGPAKQDADLGVQAGRRTRKERG